MRCVLQAIRRRRRVAKPRPRRPAPSRPSEPGSGTCVPELVLPCPPEVDVVLVCPPEVDVLLVCPPEVELDEVELPHLMCPQEQVW